MCTKWSVDRRSEKDLGISALQRAKGIQISPHRNHWQNSPHRKQGNTKPSEAQHNRSLQPENNTLELQAGILSSVYWVTDCPHRICTLVYELILEVQAKSNQGKPQHKLSEAVVSPVQRTCKFEVKRAFGSVCIYQIQKYERHTCPNAKFHSKTLINTPFL